MKRLALRISGGITLVVLAVLAFGQAHRGAPAAAEGTNTTQPPQASQATQPSETADATQTPRPFVPASRPNPLRPEQVPAEAKAGAPAVNVAAATDATASSPQLQAPGAPRDDSARVSTGDPARPINPFAPPKGGEPKQPAALARAAGEEPLVIAAAGPSASTITLSPAQTHAPGHASAQPLASASQAAEAGEYPTAQPHAAGTGGSDRNPFAGSNVVPPWTTPLGAGNSVAEPAFPTSRAGVRRAEATSEPRHPQHTLAGGSAVPEEPGLFRPDGTGAGKAISPVPPSATPARSPGADRRGPPAPAATGPENGRLTPAPSGARQATRTQADADAEGSGVPGARELEGPQAPQIVVQKVAPPEVQVGKPAVFEIRLKNTGQVPAQNVEVRDEIPKGTRLLDTQPKASRGVRGELVWSLGTVKPNEEVRLEIQLMPTDEGVLGSKAMVTFGAEASARTVATKPMLVVKTVAPPRVQIGEEITLQITVSNPGTGVAHQVVLEERVPPGLQHPAGSDLVYEVGSLKPGESRQLELKLLATQAGVVANVLTARGDANLKADDRVELEVLAPQLDIALEGPKRRYLEREATYTVSISNPGTAPARQVELIAQLPPGLKFVSANNAGHYQEATRTVHWTLEELPSKETGSVQLTTVPIEPGQHFLRLRSTADKGLSVEKELPVIIEGIASPSFQVTDTNDPVEVGGETTYQIRVFNQGSKAASNVELSVFLPPEMRLVAAEPSARQSADPGRVVFDPLQRLAPKAETTYLIRVQAIKPGTHRIRAQLSADEMELVTKEESTRVYSDE